MNTTGDKIQQPKLLASFGVGCFHFSLSNVEGFAERAYYDEVRTILERTPHITNIEIEQTTTSRFPGSPPEKGERSLNTNDGINPWPSNGRISFDVLVPKRFQESYRGTWRSSLKSENFSVDIRFNDGLPVAYITSKGPEIEDDPSTMVMIVRSHLEATIAEEADVVLTYLGPSPFHANFYLSTQDENGVLELEYQKQPGYDDVTFRIPREIDSIAALEIIKLRLSDEIGFYYEAIQQSNIITADIETLMDDAEILSNRDANSNLLVRIMRRLVPLSSAAHLRIATEKAEIAVTEFERSWLRKKREIESAFGTAVIEPKMAAEAESLKEYPIGSYRRIAEAIDSRLAAASINRTAVVAAIVGAAVSVAVTLTLNLIPKSPNEATSASLEAPADASAIATKGADAPQ